jgi:hypothetical protein
MIPSVKRGAGGHARRAGRRLPIDRQTKLGRALAGLLTGIVLVFAGGLPVAAVDGPNSLEGLSATYDVAATLKWSKGRLDVTSTATIRNNSDAAVDALTFNAAPARIGRMVLGSVTAGGQPATAVVDDQNIIVTLPVPLEPAQQIAVTVAYKSWFGGSSGNKQWLFAKVDGIATAYRWIPWLSKAYPFITPTYGEPFVTKTSDEVRVSITTDRSLSIATTGRRVSVDGLTQTFEARNVRDFNFAASPKYVTSTQTWGDVSITYYTVELPLTKLKTWTVASLDRFSQRVGPYPYNEFAVAEVPTGPSMESPGMIWITQKSVARGTLKYLVVHETAHQWFYGVIGNDQAVEPFADEAMAEFLTRDLVGHRTSNCAQSVLDRHVYDYSKSCYYEVIYVQGDLYLNAYRQRVGDQLFWNGVRRYYTQYQFKIGGTRDLLDILDDEAQGSGGGHEARFPSLYPGTGG